MIIVQAIAFTALVLVLRKILISSSYSEIKRLQQLSEENARKTRELAGKIAGAENESREKMAKAEDEIREMKAMAAKEIEARKEEIIAKGKEEGDRIVAQALSAKEEIRAEIEERMQEKAVVFSRKIFQKILNPEEQKLVHDGLLESVFQELVKIEKDRLRTVDLSGASGRGAVKVKTSRPMSPGQKEKLETILSSQLAQKIAVQEVVEREIIAGIVIVLGNFVIDGSLSERFRMAAESLKNAN